MNTDNRLENVDIEDLDAFEQTIYHDYLRKMDKVDALKLIINNVEGDYTKLSDCLAEIAEDQEET